MERHLPGFTERLNGLLSVAQNTSVDPAAAWSLTSLCAALEDHGYEVSGAQLSKMRSGLASNPSGYYLAGLSQVFQVSPLVWFNEATYEEELARLRFERDARTGHELG